MYLQLAEGQPVYLADRRKGKVTVSGYKRKSSVASHRRRYPMLNDNGDTSNPHIFVPNFETGGGLYIREDKFDAMPDNQWALFMQTLAPYQPEVHNGLSEPMFLADRASRKARREAKKDNTETKRETKTQNKMDRNTRKNDREQSREEAKQARADRRANGQGFDWDKAKSAGGSLLNKFTGGGGGDSTGTEDVSPTKSATAPSFFKLYQSQILLGGGLLLLIGGGAWVFRKKLI